MHERKKRSSPRWMRIVLFVGVVAHGAVDPPTARAADEPTLSGAEAVLGVDGAHRATRQLIRAAAAGRLGGVDRALKAGARIDENREAFAGVERRTALVAAALAGHARVVRRLLEAGADPSVPEKDGFTVWHAAAFQGHAQVLRVLDELAVPGDDVSPRDGFWPIHRAAWGRRQKHLSALEVLLSRNPSACHTRSRDGKTPLDVARLPAIRARLEQCPEPDTTVEDE